MFMNPPRPPVNYEYWPYSSNYSYACPPVQCNGCCNHSFVPSHYSWRPPYSHFPPAYYPGSYQPFPGQYMPPPHFAGEHPRFEYMPRDHHCCGCSNHHSNQKEQKHVKIEEEEPEREAEKNAALAPFKFKNTPYPLMWFPLDNVDNKELSKGSKDGSVGAKQHEHQKLVEPQPGAWSGWYPFGLDKVGPPKQEEQKKTSSNEADDGKSRFPFPVFWMPYMPEERKEDELKEINVNPKPCSEVVKDSGEQKGHRASSTVNEFPVKEEKLHEDNVSSKSKENGRNESVKGGAKTAKIDPNIDSKRKSSSPPKSPRLPPVCLRVDPLPRKKESNGSSRSPSPPGHKQKQDQLSDEVRKILSSTDKQRANKISNNEFQESKGKTKTIEVIDGKSFQHECLEKQSEEMQKRESIPPERTASNEAVMKSQSEDARSAREENGQISGEKQVPADAAKEFCKRELSEEEAAAIIQSAYRGFDIRRWEPVKKLKQIARVREQMDEVKHLIKALELSSDVEGNSKQRNIIAETIMSLLLKLDTIQGLHPSIREVRKSVVRELVGLQEKLDALVNEKSETHQGEESVMKHDGDAFNGNVDAITSENCIQSQSDLTETCQNQLDEKSHEVSETSETILTGEGSSAKLETEAAEKSESCTIEGTKPSEPMIDDENDQRNKKDEISVVEEDHGDSGLGQDAEYLLLQNNSTVDAADPGENDGDKLVPKLSQEVSGGFYAQEGTNYSYSDPAETDECNKVNHLCQDSDSNNDISDKKNQERVECCMASDIPCNEMIIKSEAEENSTNELLERCKLDRESETTKDAEGFNGDISFKPGECLTEPAECVSDDIYESSKVSDQSEHLIKEECNRKDATSGKSQEDSSMVDHSQEMPPEKEASPELGLSKELENAEETVPLIGEMMSAEEKIEDNTNIPVQCSSDHIDDAVIDNAEETYIMEAPQDNVDVLDSLEEAPQEGNEGTMCSPTETMVLSAPTEESNPENLLSGDKQERSLEAEHGNKEIVAREVEKTTARSDNASAKELMEENGKLREMVEKLVKSSQEQLSVISDLSGKVKHLEKNLSKKKKLKLKNYRAKRSAGSLKEWSDGVVV